MNKLTHLIRPDLHCFMPYSSARDEAKQGNIWLNANESPYAFTPQENILINRYPAKQAKNLVEKIAELYQVTSKQIVLSRGSDELIDLLIRLFCRAGKDAIMRCTPTYGMYSVCAQLQGANIIDVPLIKQTGYQLDLPAILSKWNDKVKIIFLCSPNNPTGNLLNKEDILFLCKEFSKRSIIVLDEAYIDFSDSDSLASCINQQDNLAILRTFSKAYGLAGARVGFLLAQEELVQWLLKIIAPYPLSTLTTQLVFETLTPDRLRKIRQQIACIKAERSRLFAHLNKMPLIKNVWPSEANFLLIETNDAKKIMRECASNGIIVRGEFAAVDLKNFIRLSIGLPEENTQLINILSELA